jgi:hypothetical protein
LNISHRVNEELRYFSIELFEDEFGPSDGGSIYDPSIGGDSYSSQGFYMQTGGYVNGNSSYIDGWIEEASELLNLGAVISEDSINDLENIDWKEEGDNR